MERDHIQEPVPLFRRPEGIHQAIAADDAVLDQAVSALGDLPVLLVGMFTTATAWVKPILWH